MAAPGRIQCCRACSLPLAVSRLQRAACSVSAYQRISDIRPGPERAEAKGLNSLSTDCGLDLDGYVTVSPCDPPPALLDGSRRLAGGGEPTCSRAPPRTYLPPPESAYGTSSRPGTAAAQSRRCSAPPPAVTTQSRSGQQVKGAGSHQDTLTPTRRSSKPGEGGRAITWGAGGRGGGTLTLPPWATG